MIVDCITFFNGLDMLEIRFNSLAPYVNRFVICESPFNTVGKSKRLYFNESKERFKQFNITHLIVHDHEKHMGGWEPYVYQIDYMLRALSDVGPEDFVMISDFDEIPDLKNFNGEEGGFRQKLYYYYLNVFTGDNRWRGTCIKRKKNIKTLYQTRSERRHNIAGPGWHFSYMCPVEEIIDKIEAFCHPEFNTPEIKNKVAERRVNLMDIFNRPKYPNKFTVEMPSGPQWLLENKERYKHLFYGELCQ